MARGALLFGFYQISLQLQWTTGPLSSAQAQKRLSVPHHHRQLQARRRRRRSGRHTAQWRGAGGAREPGNCPRPPGHVPRAGTGRSHGLHLRQAVAPQHLRLRLGLAVVRLGLALEKKPKGHLACTCFSSCHAPRLFTSPGSAQGRPPMWL